MAEVQKTEEKRDEEKVDFRAVQFYYLREGVLEKIFELCETREAVPVYWTKDGPRFGVRPSTVQFRADLESFVRSGATSFHISVEHWKNPLMLKSGARKQELDKLRMGWDLIIDIDSDHGLEFSKKAAILLVQALKLHGVKNISCKFSGRRGFHLGLSARSLPKTINMKPIAEQYPELLQVITAYLKNYIRERLAEQLRKLDNTLPEKADPFQTVHVEENWGPRHLFRAPYSFNEKTWLVSLPLELREIAAFETQAARPETVKPRLGFLDTWQENEARDLILQALDWHSKQEEKKTAEKLKREIARTPLTQAISEQYFPPCIKNILKGIKDGRKRGLFVLINFLRTVGWEWDKIEERLRAWNQANPDPIPEAYIVAQLTYAKRKKETVPPPNCSNNMYYKDIGVWTHECERMKNPASYAIRAWRKAQAGASTRKGRK